MRREPGVLREALARLDREHLRRARRLVEALPERGSGALVVVGGRRLVNFCSNDYLGLAQHPRLAAELARAAAEWGVGSGASHLVTGHGLEHARLEEALAAFTGRERALVFSTGYMANLGVIAALAGRHDLVLEDRLNHASLIDAARLCGAQLHRYAHSDARAAAAALEAAPQRAALIATDGVFSMDGDCAPLRELARLARAHHAWLVVDDAHGLGVLGAGGGGTLELEGLGPQDVPALVGTFGKAFGTCGAFVAGDAELIEWLLQRARTYIYTTAMPPALAAATRVALELAASERWRRERVLSLVERFRRAGHAAGLPLGASRTPIQPVLLGSAARAVAASESLIEAGFWVAAMRAPTVPAGSARLRVTLSAAHTEAQIDALIEALARVLRGCTS